VIAAGITPAGMEMMDRPAVHAVEDFVQAGYPLDCEALLIVELDGFPAEVDDLMGRVREIVEAKNAGSIRVSRDETERLKFWAGRKAAFPAIGRISPDYYCMDGTIPRRELPHVLSRMRQMSAQYGLCRQVTCRRRQPASLIMHDANKPGELSARRLLAWTSCVFATWAAC
jgi:glycolate oxidase